MVAGGGGVCRVGCIFAQLVHVRWWAHAGGVIFGTALKQAVHLYGGGSPGKGESLNPGRG